MSRPPRSLLSTSSHTNKHNQLPISRRLLFPNLPLSQELPPLVNPTLDQDLYHFVALALRAFVNPWWSKITRYDKEFVQQINSILAVVIKALDTRISSTDLSPLVFNDAPSLVTQHYKDIRNATSKLSTSYAAGGSATLPQLFHQLQPHMAVDAQGNIDQVYMRQIIDHILKSCLPPEDYAPEAERFIIREIILKVLIHDVFPKIAEPWFLHKLTLDLLGPEESLSVKSKDSSAPSNHFSFHALLVFFLSTIQSISGICLTLIHAYKHVVSTIKLVNSQPQPRPPSARTPVDKANDSPYISPSSASSASDLSDPRPTQVKAGPLEDDYAHPSLVMFAEVFSLNDRFASAAVTGTVSMVSDVFASFLDKLLPHVLYTDVLAPHPLLQILRLSTTTLFPNGYPAPAPPIPTPAEQAVLRRTLLRRLTSLTDTLPLRVLLGGRREQREDVLQGVLSGLEDRACNMHLVMVLVDAIVLRVFPELGVAGGGGGDILSPPGESISRSVSGGSGNGSVEALTPPGSVPP